ncbi:MAG TPA: baseplate J/gp47 family protein [Candidatus Limnocylindria bacterium]|nr:baseplate J/gp47 family protein [Candidatus Limnocylindria bacterium]
MTVQVAGRAVIDLGARATVLDAMDRVRAAAATDELVIAVAAGAPVLRSPVFLEVLRRAAPTRRIALVTPDARARSLAASVHMPAFASIAALERHELDPTEPLGPAQRAAIVAAGPRVVSPVRGIAAGAVVLVALAVVFAVVAPTATVVVAPVSQALGPLEYDLRAGPNNAGSTADIAALTLGPTPISVKLGGNATGSRTEETKASGVVRFQNQTTGDIRIPKGTIVSTSDNIRFQTLEDKTLPRSSIGPLPPFVTFGTVDIPIEAVSPGPSGNVGAQKITQGPQPAQYSVTNQIATTGGDSKKIPVIQQSDYDAVASRADGELRKQVDVQVEGWKKQVDKDHTVYGAPVSNKSITPASDVVGKDAAGGSFELTVTGTATGYSVLAIEPKKTAIDRLASTVDPDHDIDRQGAVAEIVGTPTVDAQGVHWRVRVKAEQFRKLDEAAIRSTLVGRPLDAVEITKVVEAQGVRWRRVLTWPGWWPRMPILESRIRIEKEAPPPPSP